MLLYLPEKNVVSCAVASGGDDDDGGGRGGTEKWHSDFFSRGHSNLHFRTFLSIHLPVMVVPGTAHVSVCVGFTRGPGLTSKSEKEKGDPLCSKPKEG